MPFIETVSPEAAESSVREMYSRQQEAYGYVPNYAKVFSHRPEVMDHWGKLLSTLRRPMDSRRFELVTLAAANGLKNTYCSLAHGRALTEIFSTEEVRSIAELRQGESLTDAEWAMIGFARKVAVDASTITARDTMILKCHGFSDADIFDIAAVSAARAFFAKLLDGLGAEADSSFDEMDAPLKKSLTVGRPISGEQVESLPASTGNDDPKRLKLSQDARAEFDGPVPVSATVR